MGSTTGELEFESLQVQRFYLLLILQSFDWLAGFHPDLLQAVLFIAI
jgi:hypothetical protein